jgi:repressor LexA
MSDTEDLPLTERQTQILEFLVLEWTRNQRFPTLREIARKIGSKVPHAAVCHLTALEKKGYIRRVQVEGVTTHRVEVIGLNKAVEPAALKFLNQLLSRGPAKA